MMRILLANLLWFFSTLQSFMLFSLMLHFPKAAQQNCAKRRRHDNRILFYQPTSGSTGKVKWIPYTKALQQEFIRAINPWLAGNFIRHKSLFLKRQYWCISPAAPLKVPENCTTQDNFNDDRAYLSKLQRFVTRTVFVSTPDLSRELTEDEYRKQTLLHLLSAEDLGLISIWHPSFLLILLDYAAQHAEILCEAIATGDWGDDAQHPKQPRKADKIAKALSGRHFEKLWPKLTVISCWDQTRAAGDADKLRQLFPRIQVEGKGLLATEGVVTIPWFGQQQIAAIRSHNLHFKRINTNTIQEETQELEVYQLVPGEHYSVLLSCGNGLEKYSLGDIVRCTGKVGKTPTLEFLYRHGVCDLHGEKLHAAHAEHMIERMENLHGKFSFAMLMPSPAKDRYCFFYEGAVSEDLSEIAETELLEHYAYRDARFKGQLKPLQVIRIHKAMERYRAILSVPGGAKNPPLYCPQDQNKWTELFAEMCLARIMNS